MMFSPSYITSHDLSHFYKSINLDYERRLLQPESVHISSCDSSPLSCKLQKFDGNRFIPCRASKDWQNNFSLLQKSGNSLEKAKKSEDSSSDFSRDGAAYSCLLKNELLGATYEDIKDQSEEHKAFSSNDRRNHSLFSYHLQDRCVVNEATSPYSLSPVSCKSQKLLQSPKKAIRKISSVPFKVLDAPDLKSDFHLNLLDWSSTNVLSVALGTSVYLWSAGTSERTHLCDLSSERNIVTSVSWAENGHLLAVGTLRGCVQVWDVSRRKCISFLKGHSGCVGALAWNGDIVSSGSCDGVILQRDIRTPSLTSERKLVGHKQEICGLKWSPDKQRLASSGNDNKLFVWNMSSKMPIQTYTERLAAVRAIAWSPHHRGLLASGGGGTADRCIRFWNTLTAQPVHRIDTDARVCNLVWSKHSSELVSTHGYLENKILVWKYPSFTQVAKLTGHSRPVLYLSMSPDGEIIVTGARDETLRFWNVFPKTRSQKERKSALNLFTSIR